MSEELATTNMRLNTGGTHVIHVEADYIWTASTTEIFKHDRRSLQVLQKVTFTSGVEGTLNINLGHKSVGFDDTHLYFATTKGAFMYAVKLDKTTMVASTPSVLGDESYYGKINRIIVVGANVWYGSAHAQASTILRVRKKSDGTHFAETPGYAGSLLDFEYDPTTNTVYSFTKGSSSNATALKFGEDAKLISSKGFNFLSFPNNTPKVNISIGVSKVYFSSISTATSFAMIDKTTMNVEPVTGVYAGDNQMCIVDGQLWSFNNRAKLMYINDETNGNIIKQMMLKDNYTLTELTMWTVNGVMFAHAKIENVGIVCFDITTVENIVGYERVITP